MSSSHERIIRMECQQQGGDKYRVRKLIFKVVQGDKKLPNDSWLYGGSEYPRIDFACKSCSHDLLGILK